MMALLSANPVRSAEANLAPNPGMESGTVIPEGWTAPAATDPVVAVRDVQVHRSGTASLRIETRRTKVEGGIGLPLRLQPGGSYRFSGWCRGQPRGAGFSKASLAVLCQTNQWKALSWTDLAPTDQVVGDRWRQLTGVVAIPAGTAQVLLMLYVNGEGALWLDDITVEAASAAPLTGAPPVAGADPLANRLRNGGMESGTRLPAEWESVDQPTQVEALRDTTIAHSGTASLRLQNLGERGEGNVGATLLVGGGQVLHLQAWVRGEATTSVGHASVSFLGQDAAWQKVVWHDFATKEALLSPTWRRISGSLELPAATVRGMLLLYLNGDGRLWLDDVIVTVGTPPPADALPQTQVTRPTAVSTVKPGERLLADSGFERWDQGLPTGWTRSPSDVLVVARDVTVKKQGNVGLRVEVKPVAGECHLGIALPPVAGQRLRVTGWAKAKVRGSGLQSASLVFVSRTADGEQLAWSSAVASEQLAAVGWRAFSGIAQISDRAATTDLRLSISGSGTIWLDEVQVEVMP